MDDNKELSGLTLGIVALIFAFIMPIVTFICGGIGLSKANEQIRKNPATPTTAKTLCILSMIITTVLIFIATLLKVGM